MRGLSSPPDARRRRPEPQHMGIGAVATIVVLVCAVAYAEADADADRGGEAAAAFWLCACVWASTHLVGDRCSCSCRSPPPGVLETRTGADRLSFELASSADSAALLAAVLGVPPAVLLPPVPARSFFRSPCLGVPNATCTSCCAGQLSSVSSVLVLGSCGRFPAIAIAIAIGAGGRPLALALASFRAEPSEAGTSLEVQAGAVDKGGV